MYFQKKKKINIYIQDLQIKLTIEHSSLLV